MKKTTPSGTRTRVTRRPFGRTVLSKISPTGSGSPATCSSPRAMPSKRDSVNRRRSIRAAFRPAFWAAEQSRSFAASSEVVRWRISPEERVSQSFFCPPVATANCRAACRAREATCRAYSARSVEAETSRPTFIFGSIGQRKICVNAGLRAEKDEARMPPRSALGGTKEARSRKYLTKACPSESPDWQVRRSQCPGLCTTEPFCTTEGAAAQQNVLGALESQFLRFGAGVQRTGGSPWIASANQL